MTRVYLSPPHMDADDFEFLRDAFESNWITSLGPHVDAFEAEIVECLAGGHAVALSSGTAAIHLALRHLGIGPGDEVLCSTLTFAASANPVVYERANPVFIDSGPDWNMDPDVLEDELNRCRASGHMPRAVIVTDLFGQCADYERIERTCAAYEVPLIEDAAEALGAERSSRSAGRFGWAGILSFNGNKIITTSGGGMLVSDDQALIEHARKLASQARDPAPHYEHSEIGFNYRMSNLLAAVGRGQLRHLENRVARRRAIFARYHAGLGTLPGVEFMPEPPGSRGNRWLTALTIEPDFFGVTSADLRELLAAHEIEARPIWKPLHLQPVFRGSRFVGGDVAAALFAKGICLPSGTAMTDDQVDEVIELVRRAHSG